MAQTTSPWSNNKSGISDITVTNAGSGYYSPSTVTLSNSSTSYNIIPDTSYVTAGLVITLSDSRSLNVGDTLEQIIECFGIVIPDKNLIEKYPALKEAYDEYKHQLIKTLSSLNPNLKSAFDSYDMIEKLVKNEEAI